MTVIAARESWRRYRSFARPTAVLNVTTPSSASTQTIVLCGEPSGRRVVAVPTYGFSAMNWRCLSVGWAISLLVGRSAERLAVVGFFPASARLDARKAASSDL